MKKEISLSLYKLNTINFIQYICTIYYFQVKTKILKAIINGLTADWKDFPLNSIIAIQNNHVNLILFIYLHSRTEQSQN